MVVGTAASNVYADRVGLQGFLAFTDSADNSMEGGSYIGEIRYSPANKKYLSWKEKRNLTSRWREYDGDDDDVEEENEEEDEKGDNGRR